MGDGKLLSKLTQKTVIYDFRQNDLKNGGHGAPLTPIFHKLLKTKFKIKEVTFVNIGGIVNTTTLWNDSMSGTDIGPGMCLIDRWIRQRSKKSYDENDGKSFTIELLNTDPKLKKAFSAIGSDDYLELTNIDKIENTIKKITGAKDVWDSYDDHYYAGDPGYAQYFDIEGIEPKIAINKLKGKKIPLNYEVN